MREKAPLHHRVYFELKSRLVEGAFSAGEHLDLRLLAETLKVSTTPVRAALQYLAAERLLENGNGEGFVVPLTREGELHDLYDWMEMLLVDAVRRVQVHPPPDALFLNVPPDQHDVVHGTRRLFQAIADTAGQREISLAVSNANDRLHRIRVAKGAMIEQSDVEFANLVSLWGEREFKRLAHDLTAYHERRKGLVRYIVQQANGASGNASPVT
ncbi:GntR family transcriptional regulator [Sphingobium sp.]|uniref:GntR family transcriptional regulator n=1 Tax=Sphingobium sp. TaxID=1912891 RepID=UPI000DB3FC11|nr:GntR family transcriptional regulator [Sphingobium sp.]PZU68656.1 MAG: hypothetical protein DI540_07860 [Sphingobium sp.]